MNKKLFVKVEKIFFMLRSRKKCAKLKKELKIVERMSSVIREEKDVHSAD